jgi:hypothetical protein
VLGTKLVYTYVTRYFYPERKRGNVAQCAAVDRKALWRLAVCGKPVHTGGKVMPRYCNLLTAMVRHYNLQPTMPRLNGHMARHCDHTWTMSMLHNLLMVLVEPFGHMTMQGPTRGNIKAMQSLTGNKKSVLPCG